jgi:hypothetical protein
MISPMIMLRAFTLGLLAVLMTLSGIGAATARGQMAADGVICGSGTYAVILAADGLPLFDAGGDPVEAAALPCLDCVLGHIALTPPGAHVLAITTASSDLVAVPPPALSPRLWRMGGMGRSPPRAA